MRALAAGLLPLALVCLAQDQSTFYAAWQDGLDSEHAGRWTEAAAAYRRALALRPQPAARVFTYGNNLLRDYYPRTRLARCLVELGDLDGAEAALAAAQGEPAAPQEALTARIHALRPPRPGPIRPEPKPAAQPSLPPKAAPAEPGPSFPAAPLPAPAPSAAPPEAPNPTLLGPKPSAAPEGGSSSPRPEPPAPRVLEAVTPTAAPAGPPPLPDWVLLAAGFGLAALVLAAFRRWRRRRTGFWRGRGPSGPREEASPAQAPLQVGPYQVGPLLGRGGFSNTYLARHQSTGQEVALKLPHPHRLEDPEFRQRFRQEAQLGARLDHPNLVRILDPGPPEGTPYLAMEYLPGRTLDQRLKEGGPLPVEDALAIALDVAQAMAYAHACGVVHRDLKPGNIVLTPSGARVMDLGIARIMDAATVTTTYAFLGTPLYAAPEAQLKTHVGPAADRYSLGVILFQMLAGVPPFQGETPFEILDRHRATPPPDLRAFRPEVSPGLARLVVRLMDKEPDQRPEDGEVVNLLTELAALSGPEAAPPH